MKLKLYTKDGASSKDKEVNNIPSFEGDKGIRALKDTIIAYQANARQGNACAKTRGEVRGGGKKPYRQKGTGMARAGSRRSPIWRGGGVVFGPRPRDFSKSVNRKVKALAFKRALFDRVQDGDIDLIESFEVAQPKTKLFNDVLANIYVKGKVLIVDQSFEDNTILAARNIDRVYICDAQSLNAWDLVRFDKILMSESALEGVLNRMNDKE